MSKVTFICIGAQKSGTCSLINYLKQNPDIYISPKELHFFDNLSNNKLTKIDINNYEKNFNTKKKIVGEKTPKYSLVRNAIDKIYEYNPNIKLIFLLREPISRAYSAFNMLLERNGKTLKDIDDNDILKHFEIENDDIRRGYYDEIIEYLYSKFDKKNIFIGISEKIKKNKFKFYNKIYKFLGARKLEKINLDCDTHIRKYKKPIHKILQKRLYKIYKPHNERLYKIIGKKIPIWEKYYRDNNLKN